jgi:hypothetical protein
VTPTISWTSVSAYSESEEIAHLFTELTDDLAINDFESVSTNGKCLISLLENILSGIDDDRLHELKGWISTLILSLSKVIKTGLKHPSDELIEELKLILKGLSEACNDLFQSNSERGMHLKDYSSRKHLLASKKKIITDSYNYPSPISANSSPGISRVEQNFERKFYSNKKMASNCDGLIFSPRGKVKAGKISSLLLYLKDYQRGGN